MRADQLFPSNYFRSADFNGDTVVTIERITHQDFNGEQKPVLVLRDSKDLVLNKTNLKIIARIHGNEIDDWSGKQIILYSTKVDFRGEFVPAIRVRDEIPSNSDGDTITVAEAEELKKLYSENNWPVLEVKRMVAEVAKCDGLASIPKDKLSELKEHFRHDYKVADNLVKNEEVPF